MRNPMRVAREIMRVVPDEHKPLFEWLINDFSYKAPEQCGECFMKLSLKCNELLGDNPTLFEHDWQLEMISILTTKTKEELSGKAKQ